jgi:phosphohistidine swiveling domain-containing protein
LQPSAEERAQATEARAAEEKAAQENARQFKVQCESLRESISEFANSDTEYGWHTFIWKDKEKIGPHEVLRAPKRALICYALSTTDSRHLMPAYTAFSPEGLKLARDNPYHTDVWLGCGFNIDDKAYDRNNPKYHAVVDMMFEMQKKLLNFEAQVLARGPEVTGTVVYHDSADITADSVLVVPHAGEEFHVQAMRAGAVICEVGGRLAHLVTVCRELDKPIIRMEGALRKFKLGQTVTVIPAQGKVEVHMRRVSATGDFV